MQQFMRQFAAWTVRKEFSVDIENSGIQMRLANCVILVFCIDGSRPGGPDFFGCRDRLTATAETTAGACHKLYEMALAERASGDDVIHDFLGIGRSMADTDLQRYALQPIPVGHQMLQEFGNRSDMIKSQFRQLGSFESPDRFDPGVLEYVFDSFAGDQFDDASKG